MFFIDALRHAGRAQLASFAGGAEGNREMDRSVWADTPYRNDAELQVQYDLADEAYGAAGSPGPADVDRVRRRRSTRRIAELRANPLLMPGEYPLLGHPEGPEDLEGHRRDLDRLAGRRDLRQGGRQRGRLGARARSRAQALRQARRQARVGGLPPRQRPGGADHDPRSALPLHAGAAARQGGAARPRHDGRARGGRLVDRERREPTAAASGELPDVGAMLQRPAPRCRAPPTRCWSRGPSRRAERRSPSSARRSPTSRRRS